MIDAIEFGDSELRYIGFEANRAILKLFIPRSLEFLIIYLEEVNYFWFTSEHMQNVIDDILLYNSWSQAINDGRISHLTSRFDITERSNKFDRKILVIIPITGVDCLISFNEISIETS